MGIEPTSQAWEARILPLNYTRFCLKLGHLPEEAVPFFDLGPGQARDAVEAEAFHVVGREHAAVDHGAAERLLAEAAGRTGQIADETSGERIPRPGGIEHALKKVRRRQEHRVFREASDAVLPFLDDDERGPFRKD